MAIFKKVGKCKPSNYCPVLLTYICCKIMEHILTSNIMSHNKLHGILYRFQHGFWSLRWCETQLLEFNTDVTINTHNGKQTYILIMDFSKAFDKVWHERLLAKLVYYGTTGSGVSYPTTSRLWYWRMREATVEMSPLAYHNVQHSVRAFSLCTWMTCQISYGQLWDCLKMIPQYISLLSKMMMSRSCNTNSIY